MTNQNELFFSNEFKTVWDEWLQFRKERRLPSYKPTGLKKTLSMLIRISNNDETTAIKIIEQSIEQNWQGLFELRNLKNESVNKNKAGTGKVGGEQLNQAFAKFYQGGK